MQVREFTGIGPGLESAHQDVDSPGGPLTLVLTPIPPVEPVPAQAFIFSQTVDGLLRALGPLDAAATARFQALGVDPQRPLLPAYPVEQWLEVMRLGAEIHAPGQPFEEALHSLGRHFVDGYGTTMIGKALLIGMRILGPKRTLERLARQLATGSTFFETRVAQFAPEEWSLWINRVTWPAWYFGLIERGLEHAGAKDVRVSLLTHDGPGLGATMLVKWSESNA